jgi:methyl-accepting chemotaxis protein
MIEQSVVASRNGETIASDVSKSLVAINDAGNKVNGLIEEISAASQEQAQGIDQVSRAVQQMDQVTQQNAASAEESASAGEGLSIQSEKLFTAVEDLASLVGAVQTSGQKLVSSATPTPPSGKPALPSLKIPASDDFGDFGSFSKAA